MAWGWSRGPTQAGDELGSGEAKGGGAGHHPWGVEGGPEREGRFLGLRDSTVCLWGRGGGGEPRVGCESRAGPTVTAEHGNKEVGKGAVTVGASESGFLKTGSPRANRFTSRGLCFHTPSRGAHGPCPTELRGYPMRRCRCVCTAGPSRCKSGLVG